MEKTSFIFCETLFEVEYDPIDTTGLGCIREIVLNNDYLLDEFINQKDKKFIDIGSNLGIATIIMAKLNPESTVYSFEPFKKAYDMLVNNIKLNSLTNVKTFNLAVSNKTNKSLKINIHETMSGASSTYAKQDLFENQWDTKLYDTVDCISFDEIIKNNSMTEIELLKIDCEGAEYDIIYDSDLFKNNIVKNIIGEFHDLTYNQTSHKSSDLIDYCHLYVKGIIKISTLTMSQIIFLSPNYKMELPNEITN